MSEAAKGNYYQKMTVAAGAIIGKCVECKKTNLLRWVSQLTWLAGKPEWADTHTYRMCDGCTDAELAHFASCGGATEDHRSPLLSQRSTP